MLEAAQVVKAATITRGGLVREGLQKLEVIISACMWRVAHDAQAGDGTRTWLGMLAVMKTATTASMVLFRAKSVDVNDPSAANHRRQD